MGAQQFRFRNLAIGDFWSRDTSLTPQQLHAEAEKLRDMSVANTDYLMAEGENFLSAVPYRWRN